MSQGFSDAVLRAFEPKILAQVEKFCCGLLAYGGYENNKDVRLGKGRGWTEPQNMARWCQ